MNWKRLHPGWEIAVIAFCCWLPQSALGQSASEDQVKAAYLFNFAKFVEWPATAFEKTDSPMNFCVMGRGAVIDELDSSVRGKNINGHSIIIRHIHGAEESKQCHLAFLAAGTGKQQQKFVEATKGAPILLVAEAAGFARAGGTINFLMEEGRLTFEININTAESSHLKISSKLLALAHIVPAAEERHGQ